MAFEPLESYNGHQRLQEMARTERRRRAEHEPGVIRARTMLSLALTCILAPSTSSAVFAEELKGSVQVLDGDTIRIQEHIVGLIDVDAPETGQFCFKKSQSTEEGAWPCGEEAATALAKWLSDKTIVCETTGTQAGQRTLAHCALLDQDLAEWLATYGWAVPDPNCVCETVRAAAESAKASQLGIWTGAFTMPWEWRKAH